MWIVPKAVSLNMCKIGVGRIRGRLYTKVTTLKTDSVEIRRKYVNDQIQYIDSAIISPSIDWDSMKSVLLSKHGNMNQNNIDSVLLKYIIARNKLDVASSFAYYLRRKDNSELNIGTINSLLSLCCELGKQNKLSDEDKRFIGDTYKYLHDKYKVLDSTTCENLLHALCVINELEQAHEVFEQIFLSAVPSHSAFSVLIGTLFKLDQKAKALQMIQRAVENKRFPLNEVYIEWIDYICRTYEEEKTKILNLEQILDFISHHNIRMSDVVASKFVNTFNKLGWTAKFTSIRKINGQCVNCKEKLKHMLLELDEFNLLQKNVKERIIVGSDLFVKTNPKELGRFQDFIQNTAPYDVVLDALNIFYASRHSSVADKIELLSYVINYFVQCDKTVLLLGRRHILRSNKQLMKDLLTKCLYFFTDDLSQDDPYFITAAILSGPHTDIVSKDILRSHKFVLKNEKLQHIFQRWQWQHQWMVFHNQYVGTKIQRPWSFTPIAQRNHGWHLPYESADRDKKGLIRDGTPDLATWVCLQPNIR